MKKNLLIVLAFIAIIGAHSCGSEKDAAASNTHSETKESKDTSYAQYIKKNNIKTLTAKGFQYKFGDAEQPGFMLYKVTYNESGNTLDSIVYSNNKIVGSFKNTYNEYGKLIQSIILDSDTNEVEAIYRTFNEAGKEQEFKFMKKGSLYYRQTIEYNPLLLIAKITEYDQDNMPRIITEFEYNDKGKKTAKTEYNAKDVRLSKEAWVYDDNGNNIQYIIYDITGNIIEKNYLKNYTNLGQAKLLEKYNERDSLVVSHHYEYDEKGREVKSTLYNGINQIISQTHAQYDANGNQVVFEMYEGGVGLRGKDNITYNSQNQEIELVVLGADGKQMKRRATTYNDKNLKFEVINYDKLDDPNFKIQYTYEYFEKH